MASRRLGLRWPALAVVGAAMLCAGCGVRARGPSTLPAVSGSIVASRLVHGRSAFVTVDPASGKVAAILGVTGRPESCGRVRVGGVGAALLVTRTDGDSAAPDTYRFYVWRPGARAREVTAGPAPGPLDASGSAVTCVAPGGGRIYVWEGRPTLAGERVATRAVREVDLATGDMRAVTLHARHPAGDIAMAAAPDGSVGIEWDEVSRWDDGGPSVSADPRAVSLPVDSRGSLLDTRGNAFDRAVSSVWWSDDSSAAAVFRTGGLSLYGRRSRGLSLLGRVSPQWPLMVSLGWSRRGALRWVEGRVGGEAFVRAAMVGRGSVRMSTVETIALPPALASQDVAISSAAAADPGTGLAFTTTDGELFIDGPRTDRLRAIPGKFDDDATLLCWVD